MSYSAFAHDAVSVGLGALATIALFASFPAVASEPAKVTVGYTDLDLTSDAGQAELNQRIRSAVKRVCGPVGQQSNGVQERNSCRRAAYKGARSQMQIAVAKAGERKALATALALAGPRAGLR